MHVPVRTQADEKVGEGSPRAELSREFQGKNASAVLTVEDNTLLPTSSFTTKIPCTYYIYFTFYHKESHNRG